MKLPITLIVLTLDEEPNLEYCLRGAAEQVEQIVIVDSGSRDATLDIAKKYGADIYSHPFTNQADQFNWALDNTSIRSDWVMRLDADEVVSDELWREIRETLPSAPPSLSGFYINRRVYFMGRWIRHGGYYPTWLMRLFRKGSARSEERAMDEHLVLTGPGRTIRMKHDFRDENHKSLDWWIAKHNNYSSREAKVMFDAMHHKKDKAMRPDIMGSQPERRRWLKENLYLKLPIFLRPFLYFIYRYIFRLGFLDGKEGFIFHFLQGMWYRLLVDAKYMSLVRSAAERNNTNNKNK